MSDFLWNYFYDYDAGQFKEAVITTAEESGTDNTWIITDKVKEIAKAHYNCDTAIGAPIESLETSFLDYCILPSTEYIDRQRRRRYCWLTLGGKVFES